MKTPLGNKPVWFFFCLWLSYFGVYWGVLIGIDDGQASTRLDAFGNIIQTSGQSVRGFTLNDTGIIKCAVDGNNSLDCPVEAYPGQDGDYGRDATHAGNFDGNAGFSFTTVGGGACIEDEVTGLMWEVKTDDGGLRDKNNTYSWYNPDFASNGGDAGLPDRGTCTGGIFCDTESFVQAVNQTGLCSFTDWRVPTREELRSIVDYSIPSPGPVIDTGFFPYTVNSWYWSSSVSESQFSSTAWYINFYHGSDNVISRLHSLYVRLVRSST